MRCLVTGGLGFIGSSLAERLCKEGHTVRILDNLITSDISRINKINEKNEIVIGDILNFDKCLEACSDIDIVFHNAAICSIRTAFKKPKETYEINVAGTRNLLEASLNKGVKRFVFASSAKIYGNSKELPNKETDHSNPNSPYALSKYEAENLCEEYSEKFNLNMIVLRYFSVYGPGQKINYGLIGEIIGSLLNGCQPILNVNDEFVRDFTYIDDIVEANLLCLNYSGPGFDVFNIGSGKSVSLSELLRLIKSISQKEIIPVYRPLLEGSVIKTHADITKARIGLSFKPKTSLYKGLEKTICWLKRDFAL